MTEKSHVSMEQHCCKVCTKTYDTGSILLDTKIVRTRTGEGELRKSMERNTVTGWGVCDSCNELWRDGYVALVGIDPEKSGTNPDGSVKLEDAYRTGSLAHVRKEAAAQVFDVDVVDHQFVFVDEEVIDMLKVAAQ